MSQEVAYDLGVIGLSFGQPAVDGAENKVLAFFISLLLGLEELGAHHGAHGQCHYSGYDDGYRNGDGKLTVQGACDAGEETYRDKYGTEYKRHGYKRAAQSVHGFLGGLVWRQFLLVHDAVHVLDHHYGIVHDSSYGEYKTEQGQGVEGETEDEHHTESTYKGYRHGNGGNKGGPPALQ